MDLSTKVDNTYFYNAQKSLRLNGEWLSVILVLKSIIKVIDTSKFKLNIFLIYILGTHSPLPQPQEMTA